MTPMFRRILLALLFAVCLGARPAGATPDLLAPGGWHLSAPQAADAALDQARDAGVTDAVIVVE